jgi:hypothetical protein
MNEAQRIWFFSTQQGQRDMNKRNQARFYRSIAFFAVGLAFGQSSQAAKIRITTWNLEWFPNGKQCKQWGPLQCISLCYEPAYLTVSSCGLPFGF